MSVVKEAAEKGGKGFRRGDRVALSLSPLRFTAVVGATFSLVLLWCSPGEGAARFPPRSGLVETTEPATPREEPHYPPLAPSPEPPWSGDVRVNQDATSFPQNETAIAVNPLNPLNLVGGANDYRVGDGNANCGFYTSADAGQSWGDGIISRLGFQASGDPAVGFDRAGNVYLSCLNFNRTDFANLISVSRSIDGGKTFAPPVAVVGGTGFFDFNDKPYLAVDATGGPFAGVAYVSWTHFTSTTANIHISRSRDGGATWSIPISISDTPLNQCSVPAVGPNGEVYVGWQDFGADRILLDKSTDAGLTFGLDRVIVGIVPIANPLGGFGWGFRTNSCPTIAVDTTAGPRRGTIYVAWADQRTGDADVLFTRSADGGLTWSAPTRVNDDPAGSGRHQFFPWVSVDPHGAVHLIWYDNRDGNGQLLRVFSARSTDGGLTFSPNERVSDAPFDPSLQFMGRFIGDYNGLASSPALVHALWTDSRTGNQDVLTARRPASDGPAVALGINRPGFRQGDLLRAGVVVVNGGGAQAVDLFFGVLGPDGRTMAFLGPSGQFVLGDLEDPTTFVPALSGTLDEGLEVIAPEVFSALLDGGLPPGLYILFLALARPRAFLNGRDDPGDVLAVDAKAFRFTP